MKIIANRLEIEKYLETKETNILVNNIINDYLELNKDYVKEWK